MPEWGWTAIVLLASVLVVAVVAVLATVAWYFLQLGRREAEANRPPYREPPPDFSEMDEGEKSEALEEVLASGQTHADQIKSQWAEEKKLQGWDDQDIQEFLENRPLLELN